MLHRVAAEAYALAEKELSGSTPKFNKAFAYVSDQLGRAGIKVTSDEIKAAIEKAVLDYKTKTSA
ncbi:Phage holin protein [compost metagenome]